jgi:phosphoglycolate phosphatase
MRPPGAVIFDFDLTLVESTEGVTDCANYALQALGLPTVSTDRVRQTIGLTLPHTFHALSGTDDAALMRAYLEHYRMRADAVMLDMVSFIPGAGDALSAIRDLGFRTGVVSSRFRYRIAAMLDRAGLCPAIDVVVGAEDVARHKPDPEGIHKALRALEVTAGRAFYVGDHQVDAEAAAAAGVRFVAVLSGVTGRGGWTSHDAVSVIDSVADLPGVLQIAT